MKIYTKKGDQGHTGLIGGTRVSKGELRIEAYGTVDELNSYIGLVSDMCADAKIQTVLIVFAILSIRVKTTKLKSYAYSVRPTVGSKIINEIWSLDNKIVIDNGKRLNSETLFLHKTDSMR